MVVFPEDSLLVLPPPFLGLLLRKSPLADRGEIKKRVQVSTWKQICLGIYKVKFYRVL
jgi:hypothetical protein